MKEDIIATHTATFETEGRLLQELGERLVSRADVALVELIKNSYDADAETCWISKDENSIIVMDDGHGITEAEFLGKWMRIATGDKQKERFSRNFTRTMTGAKGIGRFAVRFIGNMLHFESVAHDNKYQCRTKLTADFDWEAIDKFADLHKAEIKYEISRATSNEPIGTTLKIMRLRDPDNIDFGKQLRNQVLGIVSPIKALDRGPFDYRKKGDKRDPGFTLEIPGDNNNPREDLNLAESVLSHYFAKITIEHKKTTLSIKITHKDGRILFDKIFPFKSHIKNGVYADIRYFPRRKNMFQAKEVSGIVAWKWIQNNCGIAVIDHGFRITPYGLKDDDWLLLMADAARNTRNWRSKLMIQHFPIPKSAEEMSLEKANPMLYLPSFHQLVGAVFVESIQTSEVERPTDLIPAINREGYIHNEGYDDLVEIVRTGMELLALVDHQESRRIDEEIIKEETAALRSDFKQAIQYICHLPSLTDNDKNRLTLEYTDIAKKLENVEDYYRDSRERMDIMAMLGVLAGFMTHESRRMLSYFGEISTHLENMAKHDKYIAKTLPTIKDSINELRGQIEYSTMFIESIQDRDAKSIPVPVFGQVNLVVGRFSRFSMDRNIITDIEITKELQGPVIHIPIYSGVLLNLYTNALKAVLTGPSPFNERRIVIKAWNESQWHIIEVADTGIGIPPHLKERIWDPLFSTTSCGTGNPLGSGMGLGLSLIKAVLLRVRGQIKLVDPPPGFSTCFKVQFPLKLKGNENDAK